MCRSDFGGYRFPWVNPPQLAALAILDRDLAAFVEFGDRCQPGQSAGFSSALRSDATAAGFSSELRSASAVAGFSTEVMPDSAVEWSAGGVVRRLGGSQIHRDLVKQRQEHPSTTITEGGLAGAGHTGEQTGRRVDVEVGSRHRIPVEGATQDGGGR